MASTMDWKDAPMTTPMARSRALRLRAKDLNSDRKDMTLKIRRRRLYIRVV